MGLQVTGLEQAIARLDTTRWAQGAAAGLAAAGPDIVDAARGNIADHQATGEIAEGITTRVAGSGLEQELHISDAAPGAAFLESGRRPGGRLPPPDAIAAWMSATGSDPRFAFVTARSIARRGMPATHFLLRAISDNRGQVAMRIRDGILEAIR